MVQATPPEASCVRANIDGQEMLAVRGEDFEKLVQGCHPTEGRPEVDLPADLRRYQRSGRGHSVVGGADRGRRRGHGGQARREPDARA